MGPLKTTLCTCAALAAATALAPVAQAADGGDRGSVSVTPATPAVGADVSLRVSGCVGEKAVAVSEAFVADVQLVGADGGILTGETRVRTSLRAGSYDVRITCADFRIKGTLKVVAGSPVTHPPDRLAPADTPASPVAPVRAGGGGTAQRFTADAERVSGPGTAQAVTGIVLAGAAAGAVALRGARRRSRGTD
ncbi:hypothetical protein [Streptomyces sp. bgisy159]|uniref:hypothetical protein n=1 Tax=Streptomyces sp. bgisy159 TaxID=3413795 RepID=UPI003F49E5E4